MKSLKRACSVALTGLSLILISHNNLRAEDPPLSLEDIKRQQAIDEFTQKMKEANFPALFERAAEEFGVPADILKGVAFAETRWEQLKWPPGETVSPENGMPRPYGIMSLWDNDYFGHSLSEAAKLIGKDPQDLKDDAYQNMRGAAALLKKIYDETPKPDYAKDGEIESWTYAIAKYSGIPERDLNAQHAVDIYDWMSQGYHEYGIEWNQRKVNLGPMREELAKLKAAARADLERRMKEHPELRDDPIVENQMADGRVFTHPVVTETKSISPTVKKVIAQVQPVEATTSSWWPLAIALAAAAMLLSILMLRKQQKSVENL